MEPMHKRNGDCDTCFYYNGVLCTHNPKVIKWPCREYLRKYEGNFALPKG